MPKVIVYIRANDARSIEALEHIPIAEWVRKQVAEAVSAWTKEQAASRQGEDSSVRNTTVQFPDLT
ncbi:MAG: hypothetical protein KatS3mg015_2532 [Fimbriimonadales bacterium]|nr:MAG: hypothetical protein KatS3mg015_2532 [Fimbriimonadales bacterium]